MQMKRKYVTDATYGGAESCRERFLFAYKRRKNKIMLELYNIFDYLAGGVLLN